MRYVRELTLNNWGPFCGQHTVELDRTVYAVVAQHHEDPERSNWIGKSWFLGSMLFALTGTKPESCKAEDDWITRGEAEGWVKLVADDGTVITRTRKRGRSTQLTVSVAGGPVQKQSTAQAAIERAMGLDGADLVATAFIRQKQIARLITSDPAERTGIINGWLELEALHRAESWLRSKLTELLAEARVLIPDDPPPGDLAELQAKQLEYQVELDNCIKDRDATHEKLAGLVEWAGHQRNAAEFAEVQERGKHLRALVDAHEAPDLVALEQAADDAALAKGQALDRHHEISQLTQGEWDGQCPLTCEECPVRGEVEAHGVSMQVELGEAEIVLDEADQAACKASEALVHARRSVDDHGRYEQEIVQLRARAQELADSLDYIDEHGEPPDAEEVRAELQELDEVLGEWRSALAELVDQVKAHETHQQRAQATAKKREALDGLIRTHREALAIVGRQGAQREVAEGVLARIQRGANELLSQSGIPLSVQVQWAREGRGLAAHCDTCGSAFPSSQRVKSCEICGADRGPKLVEKMMIVPSDRSGAADDIAGLAFQLAASAWLRGKRSASWSSTCIDEPFGALDKANGRALSAHLHALIRGNYAFEQGFLVAHDASVMESLPARVQITGGPHGAELEVI